MRLLLNDVDHAAAAPGSLLDARTLERLYAYPAAGDRPWVRANMVSTLDGAATGPDRRSGSINTAVDREVFALLRAFADVIMVGAGTARAEGYRRPRTAEHRRGVRAGRPAHPALAVMSRTAQVPPRLAEGTADSGEVLMVTCERAGSSALDLARRTLGSDRVVVVGEETVDLGAAVRELHRRGLSQILCEGGPHLLRDMIGSDLLDELCLTVTPMMVAGEGPRIAVGARVAQNLELRLLIESGGTLLSRWTRPDLD